MKLDVIIFTTIRQRLGGGDYVEKRNVRNKKLCVIELF